jgi:transposase
MARRDARSLDHKTLEEIRIRAVERVHAGESPEDVIHTLGFTRSCIYTWLALYRAGGWGALRAQALQGRPMKIQPQQMSWLYRTITGKSPLQYRFEFALWTREIVRMLLAEEFQLKLSLSSVGRLLKQLGLSLPAPAVPGHRAGSRTRPAMAGRGVSPDSAASAAARGGDLLRR